jgi:7-carboxy-7-deazaguanine synthase
MFGTNKRFKKDFVASPNLVVNSVFATIQGEGPYAGFPAIFIRLSQCNLACTFCDTEFEKGDLMSSKELFELVEKVRGESGIVSRLIVFTGGEPLLQDIAPFILEYTSFYPWHIIQIETAGTVWQKSLEDVKISWYMKFICSPKTPTVHPEIRKRIHAWKYIVREGWVSEDDGLPDMPTQPGLTKRAKLARPGGELPFGGRIPPDIYVQAVDEQDAEQNKKNLEFAAKIAMRHGYKLSVQVHKYVGLE